MKTGEPKHHKNFESIKHDHRGILKRARIFFLFILGCFIILAFLLFINPIVHFPTFFCTSVLYIGLACMLIAEIFMPMSLSGYRHTKKGYLPSNYFSRSDEFIYNFYSLLETLDNLNRDSTIDPKKKKAINEISKKIRTIRRIYITPEHLSIDFLNKDRAQFTTKIDDFLNKLEFIIDKEKTVDENVINTLRDYIRLLDKRNRANWDKQILALADDLVSTMDKQLVRQGHGTTLPLPVPLHKKIWPFLFRTEVKISYVIFILYIGVQLLLGNDIIDPIQIQLTALFITTYGLSISLLKNIKKEN